MMDYTSFIRNYVNRTEDPENPDQYWVFEEFNTLLLLEISESLRLLLRSLPRPNSEVISATGGTLTPSS